MAKCFWYLEGWNWSRLSRRLWVLALIFIWPRMGSAASFSASLDRNTVTVGESVILTLNFDAQPDSVPTPPAIPNLQIENQGISRSVTIVNGQVSSTISQTFVVTPLQPGEYEIPAMQASVGGQTVASQPVKFVAEKGEQLAFFKIAVPRKEVYVGEVFPVELQVYIRDGILNVENILESFDNFNGSGLKAEGFSILRTAHARHRQTQVDGNNYQVGTLVSAVSALKTGNLTIASMDNIRITLQIRVNSGGSFFLRQFQTRQVALVAQPETLTALDLPRENVPTNFLGAVGVYTLSASAGPTNVAVGDPVTLRIKISGKGALDALTLPDQPESKEFKTLPATSKLELADPLGLQGTKTFEQVVIPQSADIKQLPAIAFSFFNPEKKAYEVAAQPGLPVVVRPSGEGTVPNFVAAPRRSADSTPASDIVPIKQRLGPIGTIQAPLVLRPWFVALQGIPLLAWGGVVVWRRRSDRLANNPKLRRRRLVAQIVREGLQALRGHAESSNSEMFFATLFRLLQEQLGECLDLPASAITEAVTEERLRPRGVPEPILAEIQELFQACNLARYAPVKSTQELQSLIPRVDRLMADLRRLEL